jgi:sn-glycerol 3-phosphate transport system permease protein
MRPWESVRPVPRWAFRDGVEGLDLGGSSAQSVIPRLIVIALTVLQFRYVERRVRYKSRHELKHQNHGFDKRS